MLIVSMVLAQLLMSYVKPVLPWLPSGIYLGAWLTLIMFALITQYSNMPAARFLWLGVIIFPASLLSRQLDMPLCDSIGGSHWLWHLFNGLTLFLSAYGLCLGQRSKSGRS
jgi:hypothetical protein